MVFRRYVSTSRSRSFHRSSVSLSARMESEGQEHGPNERPALDAAMTLSLHFEACWRRASEAER